LIVDEKRPKSEAEFNRSRIDRCLVAIEDAVKGSRTEDIQTSAVYAALGFLERLAEEKWPPFEQFRRPLTTLTPAPTTS
jgi:hypothetical protein